MGCASFPTNFDSRRRVAVGGNRRLVFLSHDQRRESAALLPQGRPPRRPCPGTRARVPFPPRSIGDRASLWTRLDSPVADHRPKSFSRPTTHSPRRPLLTLGQTLPPFGASLEVAKPPSRLYPGCRRRVGLAARGGKAAASPAWVRPGHSAQACPPRSTIPEQLGKPLRLAPAEDPAFQAGFHRLREILVHDPVQGRRAQGHFGEDVAAFSRHAVERLEKHEPAR